MYLTLLTLLISRSHSDTLYSELLFPIHVSSPTITIYPYSCCKYSFFICCITRCGWAWWAGVGLFRNGQRFFSMESSLESFFFLSASWAGPFSQAETQRRRSAGVKVKRKSISVSLQRRESCWVREGWGKFSHLRMSLSQSLTPSFSSLQVSESGLRLLISLTSPRISLSIVKKMKASCWKMRRRYSYSPFCSFILCVSTARNWLYSDGSSAFPLSSLPLPLSSLPLPLYSLPLPLSSLMLLARSQESVLALANRWQSVTRQRRKKQHCLVPMKVLREGPSKGNQICSTCTASTSSSISSKNSSVTSLYIRLAPLFSLSSSPVPSPSHGRPSMNCSTAESRWRRLSMESLSILKTNSSSSDFFCVWYSRIQSTSLSRAASVKSSRKRTWLWGNRGQGAWGRGSPSGNFRSGNSCWVVILSKELSTQYLLCWSDSLSSIWSGECWAMSSCCTSRLRSSISFSQRTGQLNFLSFLQKQKQRQSKLLQKFLPATSSQTRSNLALHLPSSPSFCLRRGSTMARVSSALGFLSMTVRTSVGQMLLRIFWTRGCVMRLLFSMSRMAAFSDSRFESISYFSSSFRSSCSSYSFFRVITKLPSVPSGTDTHERFSVPSSAFLPQLWPQLAQPSGMRMQLLPTCSRGYFWSTSSLRGAKMVTFLRLTSSSYAYWKSMLKKEGSVRQIGSSSFLNSLTVITHRRYRQISFPIYRQRSCRSSRPANSPSDNYSICGAFTAPEGGTYVRSQVSTESRMAVELGLSMASRRILAREGAASEGRKSLRRQRLRSSRSSGLLVATSWRMRRKVVMAVGAFLALSRQEKSRPLTWSQVSVPLSCENSVTECLCSC